MSARNVDRLSLRLSALIDRARRDQDLTITALAAKMRASPSWLCHLLDGRTTTSRSYARALDALHLELVVTVRPKTLDKPENPG